MWYGFMVMSEKEHPRKHATIYGSPGEMARVTGLVRTLWPVLLIVASAGYLLRAALPVPSISAPAAGVLCLLLVVAATVIASYCEKRFSAYLKGARGEERVAHALAFLSGDYVVFNGLSRKQGDVLGGDDFDHIVVGPRGVFVIETKNWARPVTVRDGRILYGGAEPTRPPLAQVTHSADVLHGQLSAVGFGDVQVRAVLCFAESVLVPGPCLVDGVSVCTSVDLVEVLTTGEAAGRLDVDVKQGLVDFLCGRAAADGALSI